MRENPVGLMAPAAPAAPAVPGKTRKSAPKPAIAAPAPAKAAWFRVEKDVNVPRHGGTFHLHEGKEISSANFDIKAIERAGGSLKKIDPPQHWVDAQLQALASHEAVNGVDPEMRATLAAQGVPGLGEEIAPEAPAA